MGDLPLLALAAAAAGSPGDATAATVAELRWQHESLAIDLWPVAFPFSGSPDNPNRPVR